MGVPTVCIVGKSDSGKTTVTERLISVLVSRGHRVAAVKHHAHEGEVDVPGKDSWRHANAGAAISMVSGPGRLGVFRRRDDEATLEELAALAEDADILVAEGFKRTGRVRVEVSRAARSGDLVCAPDELCALVTDGEHDVGDVPVFGFEDIEGLADLVERVLLSEEAVR